MEERSSHTGLLVGGLFLGGAYLLYRNVLRPNVIEPLKIKRYVMQLKVNLPAVRFKGDNVEFDLYVQNINNTPLSVNGVVGDVYVTNQKGEKLKLGNVTKYDRVVLKPLGETKYQFQIRLKFLSMLKYFQDMMAGRITHQTFSFVGTININGRLIPVKESYRIS